MPGYTPVFRPAIDFATAGGNRQLFGNMVLSRLPVLQVLPHLLPRPVDPGGRSMQRQALEVVISAPFGPLRVVTTHLEFYSAAHRMAQVERLRALHAEAAARAAAPDAPDNSEGTYRTVPRPASTLVCGDFNFEPGWPDHARMLAPFEDATPGFRDAWATLHGGTPHAPTAGIYDADQWPKGANCRDFVFLTDDLARRLRCIEVDGKTAASDHQPVLVEFDLGGRTVPRYGMPLIGAPLARWRSAHRPRSGAGMAYQQGEVIDLHCHLRRRQRPRDDARDLRLVPLERRPRGCLRDQQVARADGGRFRLAAGQRMSFRRRHRSEGERAEA